MATTEVESFWDMRAFITDILGDPIEIIRDGRFETHRWCDHRVFFGVPAEDAEVILHGPKPVNLLLTCPRERFKLLDKEMQRTLLAIIGCPNEGFGGEFVHG